MAIVHTGIRAYVFQCTYDGAGWLDNPSSFISDLQTALGDITNFSYTRLVVSNVRNSSRKELEVEIDGIIYLDQKRLTATENDNLISALETALNGITKLIYDHVNLVNDIFRDSPTLGWPGQSMEKDSADLNRA